jgi:hypothetical protein
VGGTSQDSKESQQVRDTHKLSSTERGSGQDSNRTLVSEGYSRSVERRAKDWSGQQKKGQLARGTHPLSSVGRGTSQDSKSQQAMRTHGLSNAERETFRPAKEGQPVRDTHVLTNAERGTGQDSERK